VSKLFEIALGIITSIGGFLEVGSIATSTQAGAEFGFGHAWAVLLGAICLAILMEAGGRLAAVSGRTVADHLREQLGVFFALPLLVVFVVSFLVLSSEIGGVALALQMATDVPFQYWALPLALAAWLLLWKGTFKVVEHGTATLGLVSVVFAVAAIKLHPQWTTLGANLLPHAPKQEAARYWFLVVSILGASISPYLYMFYSAGAVEEHWDASYLTINRITAGIGNVFGGGLSLAVLVCAALVFFPRHVQFERYEQIGTLLAQPLGHWGFVLLLLTLGINCFGATVEVALSVAYHFAQSLGWYWKEDAHPRDHARFSLTYTVVLMLAAVPMVLGVDPLALTNYAMTLTAASLPVTTVPLLLLMNDRVVLNRYRNGWLGNLLLGLVALLSVALLAASVPLQFLGGQ
jgi:Mn2+/Fe2+ NRAMP family transporter